MLNAVLVEDQLLLPVLFARFDVALAVFLLKSLYSAGCIDILLLARIERMAHGAYLRMDLFYRAGGLECVATAAMNHDLVVFWMYLFFHNCNSLKYMKTRIIRLSTQISTDFSHDRLFFGVFGCCEKRLQAPMPWQRPWLQKARTEAQLRNERLS